MEKQLRYAALVDKRKRDKFFPEAGLLNPAEIENSIFDCDELGAWSRWHGDLDAKILLIGQDWGDEKYFIKNGGRDSDNNPTCKNLKALFQEIGFELGTATPETPSPKGLFFTNAVLGIKSRNMSAPIKTEWLWHSIEHFTRELIEIIEPEIIITLGKNAFRALQFIWKELPHEEPMNKLNERNFWVNEGKILLFPRFHCGGLGLRNRVFDKQKEDWRRILPFLKN